MIDASESSRLGIRADPDPSGAQATNPLFWDGSRSAVRRSDSGAAPSSVRGYSARDPDDPATSDQAGSAFTDYTAFLDDESLEGARIGVWRAGTFAPGLTGPVIEPILDSAVAALEAEGAEVVEGMDIDLSATAGEFAALLCEFKSDIATYLETYVDGTNPVTGQPYPQTLAQLIEFNQDHPQLEGPWNNLVFELAEATNGRDQECADIRAGVTPPVQDAIDELMAENDLDAIVALTNGPAWPINSNPEEGDLDGHFEYFVGSSSAAAVSGYADITVPAGYIEGLPIGITFIGGRWAEPELLGLAYDYEQATQVRVPPQFIPTIGDDLFPGAPNPADQVQALRRQTTQTHRDLVVRFR